MAHNEMIDRFQKMELETGQVNVAQSSAKGMRNHGSRGRNGGRRGRGRS